MQIIKKNNTKYIINCERNCFLWAWWIYQPPYIESNCKFGKTWTSGANHGFHLGR